MSTKYYVIVPSMIQPTNALERLVNPSHFLVEIGYSAKGWNFGLTMNRELNLTDWWKWNKFINEGGYPIVDENFNELKINELKDIIFNRQKYSINGRLNISPSAIKTVDGVDYID